MITADLGVPTPVSPGNAAVSYAGNLGGRANAYQVRAVASGPLQLSLTTQVFDPVMSVYDQTGATLLGVVSRSTAGSTTFTVNAVAGQAFLIHVADYLDQLGFNNGGFFTLSATQTYTPAALAVDNTVRQMAGIPIDPTQAGQIYRITPAGADCLVLQLSPEAGAALAERIVVAASGMTPPITATGAAGQMIFLPIDPTKISARWMFTSAAPRAATPAPGREKGDIPPYREGRRGTSHLTGSRAGREEGRRGRKGEGGHPTLPAVVPGPQRRRQTPHDNAREIVGGAADRFAWSGKRRSATGRREPAPGSRSCGAASCGPCVTSSVRPCSPFP